MQFGDGSWRCFDLAADPTWRTEVDDPAVVLADAQAMLIWRSRHAERTFTDMLLRDGGIGRVPRRRPAPLTGLGFLAGPSARRPDGRPAVRRRASSA